MAKPKKVKKTDEVTSIEPKPVELVSPVEDTVSVNGDDFIEPIEEPKVEITSEEIEASVEKLEEFKGFEDAPIEHISDITVEEVEIPKEVEPIIEEIEKVLEKIDIVPEIKEEIPVVEEKVEEVIEVKIVQPTPRKLGKLVITKEYLNATPTLFTWFHKQGYVILNRTKAANNSIVFLLEGGNLDPIVGEPPEYVIFAAGNYLTIRRK